MGLQTIAGRPLDAHKSARCAHVKNIVGYQSLEGCALHWGWVIMASATSRQWHATVVIAQSCKSPAAAFWCV